MTAQTSPTSGVDFIALPTTDWEKALDDFEAAKGELGRVRRCGAWAFARAPGLVRLPALLPARGRGDLTNVLVGGERVADVLRVGADLHPPRRDGRVGDRR